MTDFEKILSDLEARDVAVVPDFLPRPSTEALAAECEARWAAGEFRRAGVGRHGARDDIRRDEILWWEASALTAAQAVLWERLRALKEAINARFYLGLWEMEAHYARYSPGAFYARHVDRLADDDQRVLSTVFYLNRDWSAGDGGALRLFLEPVIEVRPAFGTLVVFWSDRVPHEVAPTDRVRQSIACWYRRRAIPAP